MPIVLKRILITLFCLFSYQTSASNTLSINDIKWPPFFFPNIEQGNIGFGKEIINRCIQQFSYQLQYKNLPIKRTHVYMQSGELDISVYSYKKERESFVYYGKEPIFYTNYGFVSRKESKLTINNLNDIENYTFGHLAGLAHTKELMALVERKQQNNQVSVGHDIDSMFGQLLAKPQRFQVMANSLETFAWRAKQLNIEKSIKIHDFVLKRKAYFITVSKTSKNIKDPALFLLQMDQCIQNLKSTKVFQQLKTDYRLN